MGLDGWLSSMHILLLLPPSLHCLECHTAIALLRSHWWITDINQSIWHTTMTTLPHMPHWCIAGVALMLLMHCWYTVIAGKSMLLPLPLPPTTASHDTLLHFCTISVVHADTASLAALLLLLILPLLLTLLVLLFVTTYYLIHTFLLILKYLK
jgi:hypothetical protein